jgi:hypothetical protein
MYYHNIKLTSNNSKLSSVLIIFCETHFIVTYASTQSSEKYSYAEQECYKRNIKR